MTSAISAMQQRDVAWVERAPIYAIKQLERAHNPRADFELLLIENRGLRALNGRVLVSIVSRSTHATNFFVGTTGLA